MSGYGSVDDEAERAMIRVEEQIALAKSMLPKGPGTLVCVDCGDKIPLARRNAMPGTTHCVDCQGERHDKRPVAREPWAT
jgi:phage/conjugal plasmid C-4 type zinc finger TraR family protein